MSQTFIAFVVIFVFGFIRRSKGNIDLKNDAIGTICNDERHCTELYLARKFGIQMPPRFIELGIASPYLIPVQHLEAITRLSSGSHLSNQPRKPLVLTKDRHSIEVDKRIDHSSLGRGLRTCSIIEFLTRRCH
uniref:Uncharacterized protein n=1 Tax=Riptortus pedestris TaxID=329032 RepID=R4WN32_RIPPE|nr:unknown secreted protein [Riptortus pedestris]